MTTPSSIKNSIRGFSTLELMIAIAVITTTISAVLLVTLGLPLSIHDGERADAATNAASAILTHAFSQGLTSFNSVISIATSSDEIFSTSLSVTLLPDGLTKRILSVASWVNSLGQRQHITLSGIITDFKNTPIVSCSNVLFGDWQQPIISITPVAYPINTISLDSSGGGQYLVAGITNKFSQGDPGVLLFDISSTTSPILKSSLAVATSSKAGPIALAMHNTTIYAANSFPADFSTCKPGPSCSQLEIITQFGGTMSLATTQQLATSSAPYATGSGGQSAGKSIFFANNLIYLGLQKVLTSSSSPLGEEFNIIDVTKSTAPKWLGGYSIGRTVNQIVVQNHYAYLATDDPTREFIILDVHDPAHITLAGSYDAPGPSTFGYGEALAVSSTTVGLGRSYTASNPNLLFFNTATATPILQSSDQKTDLVNTLSIQGILFRSFLAFILTSSALQIWDISNPLKPLFNTSLALSTGTVSGTSAITCKGNTIYVAANNGSNLGYLYEITSK